MINSHARGRVKGNPIEFITEEKAIWPMLIMLLFALCVYENRSTLYCTNEHLKQRICHVRFITAIGFSKSSVMFILEKGGQDFQRKLIIRTVQSPKPSFPSSPSPLSNTADLACYNSLLPKTNLKTLVVLNVNNHLLPFRLTRAEMPNPKYKSLKLPTLADHGSIQL